MRFGSLFSGIEAASVAWRPLGWRCAWVAEIDPFACAVLAHRYPDVPNLGDVNRIDTDATEPVDLIAFGSPCQSFSVAGKRLGMDDPRGNMALVGLSVVERLRPRWVVFENVPGLLSSDGWRDFGAFLGALGQCGYGFAYRILDAQYFGVPQRRRRVFVVGHLGDWRPAAAVLFEPESLRGDSPPRREAGQGIALPITSRVDRGGEHREAHGNNLIAPTLPARKTAGGGMGTDFDCDGGLISIDARNGTLGEQTLTVQGGGDVKRGYSLNTIPLAFGGNRQSGALDVATAINAHGGPHGRLDFESETFHIGMSVRRLTPRECERLQGFSDDWTLVPYRGKPAADGNRYRAIGNSMAVPVIHWLGRRIQQADDIVRSLGQKRATPDLEIRTPPFPANGEPPRVQPERQRHAG